MKSVILFHCLLVTTYFLIGYSNAHPFVTTALVKPSAELAKLSGFAGTYIIVDARRSSDVSAPAGFEQQIPIGETVSFTYANVELTGAACDDWRIKPTKSAILQPETDPLLIDLVLEPTDSPKSRGDQQVHEGYEVLCEGEHFGLLHKVDDRILVMPWANSSINLILERTLSEIQIKSYQMQLKSMKFYDGHLNGKLDKATLQASRAWYEYRAKLNEQQPTPGRPAISENLLDGLGILPPQ